MTKNDDALLGLSDVSDIGFKIVEMCDRVRIGVKMTGIKGAQAKWCLEIDDVAYDVVVTMRPPK